MPNARETNPPHRMGWMGSPPASSGPRRIYLDAKDNQGWPTDRLKPLLAALAELIPWLNQWHNEPDPNLGMGLGDYFAGFLDEQCRTLGLTVEEVNKARFGDSQPG